jgi:nucleotide-binding universal stress UspA family protein
MFKKILVAYDGSEGAKLALAKAGEIAEVGKAEIHILTVGRIPEHAGTAGKARKAEEQAKEFYSKIIEEVSIFLKTQGMKASTRLEFGKPGDVILKVAEELGADLLVMGTKGESVLDERATGTTVDKVLERSRCSVLLEAPPG